MAVRADRISSPTGKVTLNFEVAENGVPTYEVSYKNQAVIKPSKMGLELKNERNLQDGFKLVKASSSEFDEIWQPVWGETKNIRNHYNELLVELEQADTQRFMAFAISAGAKIRTIATTIEEGFSLPKVEKFEELINERTKGILICNPNNPTGYLYTRREMNQIRDLVKKYDLFLFSDEVYREFIYTGSPYISACHLSGIENNVVLIDSVSKRYSECGIRIGALITKNKEIRSAVMKFCQARLSPPLIGQIAAEASLDAGEDYLRDIYDEYVERRKCLIDGLNRIPGVYSPIPMGAFYTVAKLPVDDSDKFCACPYDVYILSVFAP